MILRNAAVRYGRRTLASPVTRSLLRQLSTEVSTTTTSGPQSQQSVTEWSNVQPENLRPKIVSASRKKQRVVQDGILSLGTDSAHEHRGVTWTRRQPTPNSAKPASPAEQYAEFKRIQANTRSLGSKVEKRYIPTELISNPPAPKDVTLELLMASQTHIGHSTSLWNPANSRYIYGVRQGIHIISLETTAAHLRRAARVVEEVAYSGGLILFVGTRKGQMEIVTKAAEMSGACHLFTKWTPGSITNRDVILKLQGMKVVDHQDKELDGFQKFKGVARPLMPDLVVCLNPLENYTLLYECGLKSIPTIGVIDTNVDPSWVTYTIPANDDSLRSMSVVAGVLGRAGEAGQKRRLADAKKGNATWDNPQDLNRHIQKETAAALAERKAVMGRLQANIQGFNEDEQNLLRSRYQIEDLEVSENEMLGMMGETALEGAKEAVAKTTILSKESDLTLESVEEQLADLKERSQSIELEIKSMSQPRGSQPSLASIEVAMDNLKVNAQAIEAEIKGTGKQE
ncbi:Fc.00g014140.m01.CDS01 [Cosmosporella sp. VM-42]